MKTFQHSRALAAPPSAVLELITTEAYLRARYNSDSDKLLAFELDVERDDADGFETRLLRKFDATGRLPGPAKRLVGNAITVVQETSWQRSGPPFSGHMRVTVPGMPGSISADLQLEEDGTDATRMRADGKVAVKVPLVGGTLEGYLVDVAKDTFAESMDAIAAALDDA